MTTHTLVPDRVHGVSTGNSSDVSVPSDIEFVRVILHRRNWRKRGGSDTRSKEALRVGLWLQAEGGAWMKLIACGVHGGNFEHEPGNPNAGIKPTSSMSIRLPVGINRKVRVDYAVRVPGLNTKIEAEFRTAVEQATWVAD